MYGFTQTRIIRLPSSDMTLCEFSHESGAKLVLLDCDSEERAFGAVFKTVPFDSTGVFHIIEHSVVSGSEKYPVASPILYMMKNSMKNYVNAITFQGKTAYLCSSCNEKDFENLLSVWLDAAFKPLLSPKTFMREGWHIEKRGDDFAVQGVVFNEMSGAMSVAENAMYLGVCGDLFPDTYQKYSSGGLPQNIPALTYEKFIRTYEEFYSADNCVLFLSGKADRDFAMRAMDGYLKTARKSSRAHNYSVQSPVIAERRHGIASLRQTNIVFSYCLGEYGDVENFYAATVLADCLFGNNSSYLKSKLLASGLVKDVKTFFIAERHIAFAVVLYGADERDKDKISSVTAEALSSLVQNGIDKRALSAAFAQFAFGIREGLALLPVQGVQNFAGFADNIFNGLPADTYFNNDDVLEKLRAAVEGDYYERLIEKLFLNNNHRAVSVFVPQEKAESSALSAFGEEEKQIMYERFLAENAKYAGDSPEALAKMPSLRLSDIPSDIKIRPLEICGNVMFTQAETNGIAYVRYYFSAKGFSDSELAAAKLLCSVLTAVQTQSKTAEEISAAVRLNIGRVGFDMVTPSRSRCEAEAYFRVSLAFAEENKQAALTLIAEILRGSVFGCAALERIVAQEIIAMQTGFGRNAFALAENAAASSVSAAARLRTLIYGYPYYAFLKNAREDITGLSRLLERTAEKLFAANRLITGVTGKSSCFPLELPETPVSDNFVPEFGAQENTAYEIPSNVNCNVKVFDCSDGLAYSGKHLAFAKLLSLGYLWRSIRERGGAYGAGLKFTRSGLLTFYSVYDPSVAETYGVFNGVAEFLKTAEFSEREIEGCIVAAAADFFKPLSAEEESKRNEFNFLCGISPDDIRRSLSEALQFKKEDIAAYIEIFERAAQGGNVCSVGNGNSLRSCGLFENVVKIS